MALKLDEVEFWRDYCGLMDIPSFKLSFVHHLKYTQAEGVASATPLDIYMAAALAVRDRLIERMLHTQRTYQEQDVRRVYYLSLEFLMGRYLVNNVLNLNYFDTIRQALGEMGLDLEDVVEGEPDAGLGNGGLGRLAACFLDSLATMEYPAYGYGLRYDYGIFRQELHGGWQVERPDDWLRWGNPWEMARPESFQIVEFDGRVERGMDRDGHYRPRWVETRKVLAQPYDTPVLGYGVNTVNLLRLWSARSSESFDFQIFNTGDYVNAVLDKVLSETITRVLYPNDETAQGRELRFRQQVFFVQATLKDIIRRYRKNHRDFGAFAEKNTLQLNDTHPAMAVSELMRLLVDVEGLPWDFAWDTTVRSLGYTNHTLLPEALERWPVDLVERVTPRNLEIIYEVNRRFLDQVELSFPGDGDIKRRMSIIEEEPTRQVRMAHLAIVGSHHTNGVAQLHTKLLTERVVPDFARMLPERFVAMTNGVTQRRWLLGANQALASWLTERLGARWITNLEELEGVERLADDDQARRQFAEIKQTNKDRLAQLIERETGILVDRTSIFDVLIKRIHEYKRQHMAAIHVLMLYHRIKRDPGLKLHPRTFVFAGKAAPGYAMAKRVIRLITAVGELVNDDPDVAGRLKVVFLPNYRVSLATTLFPAADVSEQISTAGKEASGTGNMKFALNGAVTLGTLDGANVEILERVGEDNMLIFGMDAGQIEDGRATYDPWRIYDGNEDIRTTLDHISSGSLTPEDRTALRPIVERLLHGGDPFFVLADLPAYTAAQDRIDELYRDRERWIRMAMLNVARTGYFSSDRTIRDYANSIWNIEPVSISLPEDGPACGCPPTTGAGS